MRSTSRTCASRSAGLYFTSGGRLTITGCSYVVPPTVSLTVYRPGSAACPPPPNRAAGPVGVGAAEDTSRRSQANLCIPAAAGSAAGLELELHTAGTSIFLVSGAGNFVALE